MPHLFPHCILTPLPNGISPAGHPQLTVHVTLRTSLDDPVPVALAPFAPGEDPFRDWPERLASHYPVGTPIPFQVRVTDERGTRWVKADAHIRHADGDSEPGALDGTQWRAAIEAREAKHEMVARPKAVAPKALALTKEARDQVLCAYGALLDAYDKAATDALTTRGVRGSRAEAVHPDVREVDGLLEPFSLHLPASPSAAQWHDHVTAAAARSPAATAAARLMEQRDLARLVGSDDRLLKGSVLRALEAHSRELAGLVAGVTRNRADSDRLALIEGMMVHAPASTAPCPTPPAEHPLTLESILSRLGNEPAILPRLGLAFDVELDMSQEDLGGEGELLVSLKFADDPTPSVLAGICALSVRTAYTRNTAAGSRGFALAGRPDLVGSKHGPSISGGMLDVDKKAFSLSIVDDGAALFRVKHHAEARPPGTGIEGGTDKGLPGTRSDRTPPPLPGAGLSLMLNSPKEEISLAVKDGELRAEILQRELLASATGATEPPILYAEDLLLGYRVDVRCDNPPGEDRRDHGKWKSLCLRTGSYTFINERGKPLPHVPAWHAGASGEQGNRRLEGFIQYAPKIIDGDPGMLNPPEVLFRWDNWSLVVPRDKREQTLDMSDESPPECPTPHAGNLEKHPLRVHGEFSIPERSLTPMRYGGYYAFRCRAVDIAGNSLSCDEVLPTDTRHIRLETPRGEIPFSRTEPIQPPSLLLDRPLDQYRSPGEQMSLVKVSLDGQGESSRWIVPPRVSQWMAELHGEFDRGFIARGAFEYARRDADGAFVRVADVERRETSDPSGNDAIFASGSSGESAPYYPDPLAQFARLDFYDGRGAWVCAVDNLDFYRFTKWPDAHPILLTAVAGRRDSRCLTVSTRDRKARGRQVTEVIVEVGAHEIVTARLSCRPIGGGDTLAKRTHSLNHLVRAAKDTPIGPASEREPFDLLGLPRITRNQLGPAAASQAIFAGLNELITPGVPIVFAHPLRNAPALRFTELTSERRRPGDTAVALEGIVAAVQTVGPTESPEDDLWKGVGAIDIEARWTDSVDDVAYDAPREVGREASPLHQRVERTEFAALQPVYAVQEFGDTRRHDLEYTVLASSAHADYFPSESGKVPRTAGEKRSLLVRSSARPAPPDVEYIIPTSRWRPGANGAEARMARERSSFRIYLRRPWFSSGNGELLAVLVAPPGTAPARGPDAGKRAGAAPRLLDVVSQWGADPIRIGSAPQSLPGVEAFTNRLPETPTFAVEELVDRDASHPQSLAEIGVRAVLYKPIFDAERRLWYCDVELDTGTTYFPFVRFALARCQLGAMPGLELSNVVLADTQQALPARLVTAARSAKAPGTVEVTVSGPVFSRSSADPRGTRMRLSLEQRRTFGNAVSGWAPVPLTVGGGTRPHIDLEPTSLKDGVGHWTASVVRPGGIGLHYRVVVREVERHQIDPSRPDESAPIGERIVFASILEV